MTQENFLLTEDSGVVGLEDGFGLLLQSSFVGTLIENPFAITDAPTRRNMCERSGFPALPHELVKDEFNDRMVLREFRDKQDRRLSQFRSRKRRKGPRKQDDTKTERFISTSIAPEDL